MSDKDAANFGTSQRDGDPVFRQPRKRVDMNLFVQQIEKDATKGLRKVYASKNLFTSSKRPRVALSIDYRKTSYEKSFLFQEEGNGKVKHYLKKLKPEKGTEHIHNLARDTDADAFFKENGFVVVQLENDPVIRESRASKFITNVWNETMEDCCWREEPIMITNPEILKAMRNDKGSENMRKQIMAIMKKQCKNHWFFQHKEGAPASCRAFHNRFAWKYRGDTHALNFAIAAMETDKLYCNIDRAIIAPPGAGCDKMPHSKRDLTAGPDSKDFSIEGEYYAVDAEFLAIPTSHKHFVKIRDEHFEKCQEQYPNADKFDVEFCLDLDNDPLNLARQCKVYKIPAGCTVLWHSELLRATRKNRSKSIMFGQKLGYSKIPTSHTQQSDQNGAFKEVVARYDCWRYGSSPVFYPSGEEVHLYPPTFRDRPSAWAEICDRISQSKCEGKLKMIETPLFVPSPHAEMIALHVEEERPDKNLSKHIPFPLTQETKELLVGAEHVSKFEWNSNYIVDMFVLDKVKEVGTTV